MQVGVTPWGATVTSIVVPDRHGILGDVVLGYHALDGYLTNKPYFGVTVGRYANRIKDASFRLEGSTYHLAANNGTNTLHGGIAGFNRRLWRVTRSSATPLPTLELAYDSPDGEEGYPGAVHAKVTFTLTESNELHIDYRATTDKPTVLSMTNHAYFNLAGEAAGSILDHRVQLNAAQYTPIDAGLVPTGEIRAVAGTPFDFRSPHPIGERIDADDEQLVRGRGYDHNWVLDGAAGTNRLAARVVDPYSGRVLEVLTTEPGVQFYSGNFLDGTEVGKSGRPYAQRSGFCMETQHFPDSPNHPLFPSTVIRPGEIYRSQTTYRFTTER
jgi:aldose 1-epimerase